MWLDAVEQAGSGESSRTALSETDQFLERMMMGLRLRDGIDLDTVTIPDEHSNMLEKLDILAGDGLVDRAGPRLSLTKAGRPLLNAVLRELLA